MGFGLLFKGKGSGGPVSLATGGVGFSGGGGTSVVDKVTTVTVTPVVTPPPPLSTSTLVGSSPGITTAVSLQGSELASSIAKSNTAVANPPAHALSLRAIAIAIAAIFVILFISKKKR